MGRRGNRGRRGKYRGPSRPCERGCGHTRHDGLQCAEKAALVAIDALGVGASEKQRLRAIWRAVRLDGRGPVSGGIE